ncbi:MAG: galactokinase [Verrucomicrobia bacterium]|nr:galactokinase [Verrucomicrobiota bacterium]
MKDKIIAQFKEVFGAAPDIIARAPGRIEFIGNHTDYNGGTVLGAAIDRGIWVAVRAVPGNEASFYSGYAKKTVKIDLARAEKQAGDLNWVNYPLGVWTQLPAFGLKQPGGFQFLDISDLPSGAGMSSSAAIELASALAFAGLTGEKPSRETLVKVAKKAENEFVGVPCGILDQGVSGFGKKDHLVFIDCRGPVFETVPLPADAHFWVFNTHTKHALVDGLYAARHRECMEAAKVLGASLLVEATLPKLEAAKGELDATAFKRAKHVIEEIERVAQVRAALAKGDLVTTGRLLTASHRSSQAQFENSTPELDFLVDTLATTANVFGARLTGGGFGGAVMAMTNGSFAQADADRVAGLYEVKFGAAPDTLHLKTGPGAEYA